MTSGTVYNAFKRHRRLLQTLRKRVSIFSSKSSASKVYNACRFRLQIYDNFLINIYALGFKPVLKGQSTFQETCFSMESGSQ